MSKLILLVGPPGSGKTTLAKDRIFNDGDHGADIEYINQDLQGKEHLHKFQYAVSTRQNIIVDRMGFNKQQRDRYLIPAKEAGYETEIIVLHESYDTCFKRCMERKDHPTVKTEENAIHALNLFFSKYERVQDNEADKVTRVWPEGPKPSAIVCDLDGTLCNTDARQHFVRKAPGQKKDWKSFFDGIPNDPVHKWCVDILKAMSLNNTIVYCSGRSSDNRQVTVEWLRKNGLYSFFGPLNHDFHLYMRNRKDSRQDYIVKEIILDFELLTRFAPYFMIDDRDQVVTMWRSRGFTCLQCARGDF